MWRVLVVEDDVLQAEHICDLLVGEGMEPLGPMPDVEAALRVLDTTTVDGAILDIRLHNGLCFDVARTLTARHIPFLLLTGSPQVVLPAEFRAVPVLHKPFEPATLFALLRRVLPAQPAAG